MIYLFFSVIVLGKSIWDYELDYCTNSCDWVLIQIMKKQTTNSCLEYYRQLHNGIAASIDKIEINDLLSDFTSAHAKSEDIHLWLDVLSRKREVAIFEVAFKEYNFALLCLVQGFYRQAFSSLRLFLELALSAVKLSTNELDLRMWFLGKKDIIWAEVVDDDKGLFSNSYMTTFCPELLGEAKHVQGLSKKLYRECSEFVHGNHASNKELAMAIGFSKDIFQSWVQKSKSSFFIVQYVLAVRYINDLSKECVLKIESSLVDELGHINGFRTLLQ